jgi:hypothetical protein
MNMATFHSSFLHREQDDNMPTKLEMIPPADEEKRERLRLTQVIGKEVLQALGRPDDLQQVQVRPLWENHYRVNVFTGRDASSVCVANSFFLVADGVGNIIKSVPVIRKQY